MWPSRTETDPSRSWTSPGKPSAICGRDGSALGPPLQPRWPPDRNRDAAHGKIPNTTSQGLGLGATAVVTRIPTRSNPLVFAPTAGRMATYSHLGRPDIWEVTAWTGRDPYPTARRHLRPRVQSGRLGLRHGEHRRNGSAVRLRSGLLRLALHGPAPAGRVSFSPDGSMLASRNDDSVRIWALDIDDLIAIARQNITRSLTDEECRRHPRRSVSRRLTKITFQSSACPARSDRAQDAEAASEPAVGTTPLNLWALPEHSAGYPGQRVLRTSQPTDRPTEPPDHSPTKPTAHRTPELTHSCTHSLTMRPSDDGGGERRHRDRVRPHPRHPRAPPQRPVAVRDRYDGRLFADPDPLELAVRAEALVLVAERGRSGQQLLELLVAVELGYRGRTVRGSRRPDRGSPRPSAQM